MKKPFVVEASGKVLKKDLWWDAAQHETMEQAKAGKRKLAKQYDGLKFRIRIKPEYLKTDGVAS